MLVKNTYNGIYERIITDRIGRLVRVQFAVVEVDGVMRGRVISVTPIVSVAGKVVAKVASATRSGQLYLPVSVRNDIAKAVENIFKKPQASPYVSFEFFMSQPTRAPSL